MRPIINFLIKFLDINNLTFDLAQSLLLPKRNNNSRFLALNFPSLFKIFFLKFHKNFFLQFHPQQNNFRNSIFRRILLNFLNYNVKFLLYGQSQIFKGLLHRFGLVWARFLLRLKQILVALNMILVLLGFRLLRNLFAEGS